MEFCSFPARDRKGSGSNLKSLETQCQHPQKGQERKRSIEDAAASDLCLRGHFLLCVTARLRGERGWHRLTMSPTVVNTTVYLITVVEVWKHPYGCFSLTPKRYDRLYTFCISISAFFMALYMLFFRLSDAIHSAIMRSAHDIYVAEKKQIMRMDDSFRTIELA